MVSFSFMFLFFLKMFCGFLVLCFFGSWVSVRIGKKDLNFRIGLFDVLTGVVILC